MEKLGGMVRFSCKTDLGNQYLCNETLRMHYLFPLEDRILLNFDALENRIFFDRNKLKIQNNKEQEFMEILLPRFC